MPLYICFYHLIRWWESFVADVEHKSSGVKAQSCEGVSNSLWNMPNDVYDHCFRGTDKSVLIPQINENPLKIELPASPKTVSTELYVQTKDAVPFVLASTDMKNIDNLVAGRRPAQDPKRESGVYVRPDGLLVIAHHLIQDGRTQLAIFDANGVRHNAKIVLDAPEDDLTLVKVEKNSPTEKFHALPIGSSKNLKGGDQLSSVGHALGQAPAFLENGKVVGPIVENKIPYFKKDQVAPYSNGQREMLEIDALISPGNSGGAWVKLGANKKAQLMAINDFSNPANSVRRAYAVPGERVLALVKRYEKMS
jgi:S1-C subfamily serine protease